jgi:RND superfamily putative drug exporter
VLLQSADGRLTVQDPAFKAAIGDTVARLRAFRTVTEIKSPLLPQNQGQISRDGRSALVDFDIRGDADLAEDRVDPILAAVAKLDDQHAQVRIEEFGEASADKAISKAFEDDFRKAETLSLPITLDHPRADVRRAGRRGLPLLLGLSAVAITLGCSRW